MKAVDRPHKNILKVIELAEVTRFSDEYRVQKGEGGFSKHVHQLCIDVNSLWYQFSSRLVANLSLKQAKIFREDRFTTTSCSLITRIFDRLMDV